MSISELMMGGRVKPLPFSYGSFVHIVRFHGFLGGGQQGNQEGKALPQLPLNTPLES